MFNTEKEMSLKFERYLKITFGNSFLKEQQGLFGIPDFVFYVKNEQQFSIVSFELKLKDWKRAAKQAFRYKSFSNMSYVVLSSTNTQAAINNIDLFKKYRIGLASFTPNFDFEILYKPEVCEPYSKNLKEKLLESVSTSRKRSKNFQTLV